MKVLVKAGALFLLVGLWWLTISKSQDQVPSQQETPLLEALKTNDMAEITRQLSSPDVKNKIAEHDAEGNTPLHVAVYRDLITSNPKDPHNIVQRLVDAGANVAERNFSGNSVLHFARTKQMAEYLLKLDAIKALYARSTPGDVQNKNGDLPIHLANSRDELELFLLQWPHDMRADIVNYKDEAGNTPIFFTLNPEAANYLEEVGARVNVINNAGQTPLMFVIQQPTFEYTKIPGVVMEKTTMEIAGKLQKDADAREAMAHHFITAGEGKTVKSYNGENIDFFAVQSHTKDGNTALHELVVADIEAQVMAELVQAIIAASRIGKKLVAIKNNKGETPLDLLEKRNQERKDNAFGKVIDLLREDLQ